MYIFTPCAVVVSIEHSYTPNSSGLLGSVRLVAIRAKCSTPAAIVNESISSPPSVESLVPFGRVHDPFTYGGGGGGWNVSKLLCYSVVISIVLIKF